MDKQDAIFKKISEALLMDYSSVYYVNAVTNEYYGYSVDPEFLSLSIAQTGNDFFANIIRDCKKVIYEEDQHIFIEDIQKERLQNALKKGTMQNIEYRLMINGEPVWHSLRMIRGLDDTGDYYVLGVINIDEEYHRREQEKETARQKVIYDMITASLAGQYDTLYYVDVESNTYTEISSTDEYKKLNVPATGSDFFAESRRSIRKYVHPEDQPEIIKYHHKDVMLDNLKHRNSYSVAYRLVVNGKVKNIRNTEIMAGDGKHIVVCIENIDEEVRARDELRETKLKSITYSQIAESLAIHYDMIYYVDARSSHYMEFSTHKLYGELEIQEEGDDFFGTAQNNVDRLIHPEDSDRIRLFLDRDKFLTGLENSKSLVEDYRMVVGGGDAQYTRMTIRWSSDKSHFIICIENRDEDMKKEAEHLKAIAAANEIARRDNLTGARNITAYREFERDLQAGIKAGDTEPFGIVLCDINDLKTVNDTQGHKAGDNLIKLSYRAVCRTFAHSPVFRIGGDEFAVILKGEDYEDRERLLASFRRQAEESIRIDQGPTVASGLAEYNKENDMTVEDISERADESLRKNKEHIKELLFMRESHSQKEASNVKVITDDRRKMIDSLFRSYEVVTDGSYVFVCDMKYDYSR